MNQRNFGFRKSFGLYKNWTFALILLRDFNWTCVQITANLFYYMKLFHSTVIVDYVQLRQVFCLLKRMHLFYLNRNELTVHYQETIHKHLPIPFLKHLWFPQRPYVDKKCHCRQHTAMFDYLTEFEFESL